MSLCGSLNCTFLSLCTAAPPLYNFLGCYNSVCAFLFSQEITLKQWVMQKVRLIYNHLLWKLLCEVRFEVTVYRYGREKNWCKPWWLSYGWHGMRNPRHGIQNPRLFGIPLHGAKWPGNWRVHFVTFLGLVTVCRNSTHGRKALTRVDILDTSEYKASINKGF